MAVKKYRKMTYSLAVVHFLTYAAYGFAFWYGASLIEEGLATPGAIFAVFFSVLAGAFSIGNALPFIHAAGTAAGAVVAVMCVVERVPPIDPYDDDGLALPAGAVRGRVQFQDVCFKYPARPGVQVGLDASTGWPTLPLHLCTVLPDSRALAPCL